MAKSKKGRSRSKVFKVVVFSDVHFDSHCKKMWSAFKDLHARLEPDLTVVAGDIIEGAVASDYEPEENDSPFIVHDLRVAARELNTLGGGILLDGNHDVRLHKRLGLSQDPISTRGLKGLTFAEQMYAQGLSREWKWVFENNTNHGLYLGSGEARTLIRHGDHQFRMGPKHVAAAMLDRSPHCNHVFGHFHRTQLFYKTSLGRTHWALSLGTFQKNRAYQKDPNWQRGFAVLYFWGGNTLNKCSRVMPVIVPYCNGEFCEEALAA